MSAAPDHATFLSSAKMDASICPNESSIQQVHRLFFGFYLCLVISRFRKRDIAQCPIETSSHRERFADCQHEAGSASDQRGQQRMEIATGLFALNCRNGKRLASGAIAQALLAFVQLFDIQLDKNAVAGRIVVQPATFRNCAAT